MWKFFCSFLSVFFFGLCPFEHGVDAVDDNGSCSAADDDFRTLVKFVDNFSWQMYNTIIDWSATFGKSKTNKGNKLNQPVCVNIIL